MNGKNGNGEGNGAAATFKMVRTATGDADARTVEFPTAGGFLADERGRYVGALVSIRRTEFRPATEADVCYFCLKSAAPVQWTVKVSAARLDSVLGVYRPFGAVQPTRYFETREAAETKAADLVAAMRRRYEKKYAPKAPAAAPAPLVPIRNNAGDLITE